MECIHPWTSADKAQDLVNKSLTFMFLANRVAQTGQCLQIADALLQTVDAYRHATVADDQESRCALSRVLSEHCASLEERLAQRRHYVSQNKFWPQYLLFEFSSGWIIRKEQVRDSNRVWWVAKC